MQRRGLFSKLLQWAARFSGKHDWLRLMSRAEAIDAALQRTMNAAAGHRQLRLEFPGVGRRHRRGLSDPAPAGQSGELGRCAGAGKSGTGHSGAAFAIPGSLGVQEGGYLLLAPLAGLAPEVALALSLAKRAREVLLAVPGLVYLHLSERRFSYYSRPR